MRNNNQILHGDQTRSEEKCHTVDPALRWAEILVTRMLMSDIFAVANLLGLYLLHPPRRFCFLSALVCLSAGLHKNYSSDFRKIQQAVEFWW